MSSCMSLLHTPMFIFLIFYLFLEGKEGKEKERESSVCGCLSHAPYWGPGLQPRHVPWPEIEVVTLWITGLHSIHWATPARAMYTPIFRLEKYVKALGTDLFSGHLSYTSILFYKWMNVWIMDYNLICIQNAFYKLYWSNKYFYEKSTHKYASKIKNKSFLWVLNCFYSLHFYLFQRRKEFHPLKEPLHFLIWQI